jgi:hypothetical protein
VELRPQPRQRVPRPHYRAIATRAYEPYARRAQARGGSVTARAGSTANGTPHDVQAGYHEHRGSARGSQRGRWHRDRRARSFSVRRARSFSARRARGHEVAHTSRGCRHVPRTRRMPARNKPTQRVGHRARREVPRRGRTPAVERRVARRERQHVVRETAPAARPARASEVARELPLKPHRHRCARMRTK